MSDATERLITAWLHWEEEPGSRARVVETQEATRALGLSAQQAVPLMQAARRSGMSIPDAVQTVMNQLAPREVA